METFAALADPTRRKIIEILADGARSSTGIASGFKISAPAVSQHLKVLREARLVRVTVHGRQRIYELDSDGMEAVWAWIDGMRGFWTARLDALAQELDKEERE